MLKGWGDRLLWGIRFTDKDGRSFMIGKTWHRAHNEANKGYPGEPSAVLLFRTRKHAREYCETKRVELERTGDTLKWRFHPVRVVESVTPLRR